MTNAEQVAQMIQRQINVNAAAIHAAQVNNEILKKELSWLNQWIANLQTKTAMGHKVMLETDWAGLPIPQGNEAEDDGWFVGTNRDDTFIDIGWLLDPEVEKSAYAKKFASALKAKFNNCPSSGWLHIHP